MAGSSGLGDSGGAMAKARPARRGYPWEEEEEDSQLKAEIGSGLSVSEIAKIHQRTNLAIRARLGMTDLSNQCQYVPTEVTLASWVPLGESLDEVRADKNSEP